MELTLTTSGQQTIARLTNEAMIISTVREATDLMGHAHYLGADSVILHERNLAAAFFELKTGIAGEIRQKYASYRIRLAIVGDFEQYSSHALSDFISECNRGQQICFVPDLDTAISALS